MSDGDSTPKDSLDYLNYYYKAMSPGDILGNPKILKNDATPINDPDFTVAKSIFDNYMSPSPVSGTAIIKSLQSTTSAGKGVLFNTVFQKSELGSSKAQYLESKYWQCLAVPAPPEPAKKSAKPKPNPAAEAPPSGPPLQLPPENFYKNVCRIDSDSPPIDFSINVLRTPLLNPSRRNTDKIEFFLNNIPSIFASQMVPYLDVEFQFPRMSIDESVKNDQITYLNRPSLLRFMLGSEVLTKYLTEADKSLMGAITFDPKLAKDDTVSPEIQAQNISQYAGMEMFTTPQTMTNMYTLNAQQSIRLNDVKPFLPPASLIGASIQVLNAGAGMFMHKTATIDMKIHDKARLVEFSEFVRGPAGSRNVTIWLTYGWLAPRGRGMYDTYAKFINENMLVREAFSVKNASFSFDNFGQVSMKVELVSKGMISLEQDFIGNENPSVKTITTKMRGYIEEIKKLRSSLGTQDPGSGQEIRVFQVIDSVADGNFNLGMTKDVAASLLANAKAGIEKSKKMSLENKKNAKRVIDDAAYLLGISTGADNTTFQEQLKAAALQDIENKFKTCGEAGSPDPFMPIAEKLKIYDSYQLFTDDLITHLADKYGASKNSTSTKSAKVAPAPKKTVGTPSTGKAADAAGAAGAVFDNAIAKANAKAAAQASAQKQSAASAPQEIKQSRSIVSLGKIFCTFVLPSLLESAQHEGIKEVQINFYQFNESCGPISLHNIAEFPIDLQIFKDQFANFTIARGGERMTIQDFMGFVSENQIGDNRSLGYGMRAFYEPYDINSPEATKSGDADIFEANQSKWFAQYGTFKRPSLAIKTETIDASSNKSKSDLLFQLQGRVGTYKSPVSPGGTKIKRIHIYDKTLDAYVNTTRLLRDQNGEFLMFDSEPTKDQIQKLITPDPVKSEHINTTTPTTPATTVAAPSGGQPSSPPQVPPLPVNPTRIQGGKDVLREYLGNVVPTIRIGSNSTMINNASIASKMDGLLGTINALGGSYKAKSTLANNGLSETASNIPMRLIPAQLTMNSMGCPLAEIYQQYFVDFDTGTTIDNTYACTQLSHNISPGKFDTSWTFSYVDGYGKFFGAANLKDVLTELAGDKAQAPPELPDADKKAKADADAAAAKRNAAAAYAAAKSKAKAKK